jgi:hypothetical protein
MIDHQIVSSELKENLTSIEVVNVFTTIPLYAKTTSDHLPILSGFDVANTVTGLPEDRRMQVHPNPTTSDIFFPPGSDITIINSLNEIIMKKESAYPPISINEYAPGIYSIIVGTQTFRIVKN